MMDKVGKPLYDIRRTTRWIPIMLLIVLATAINLPLLAQEAKPGSLQSAERPVYPLTAKAAGIEGPVTVRCVIGKDGQVRDVHAVKGPVELRQAAVDAVSRWTYHPYTHFGRLVEVDTTVTVNFTMGSGQEKLDQQQKAKDTLAKQAAERSDHETDPVSPPN
jgi:TonB family protein